MNPAPSSAQITPPPSTVDGRSVDGDRILAAVARAPRTWRNNPALLDQRSLELHRLIAAKLAHDPTLFEGVQATLKRWATIVDRGTQPYVRRWQIVVDQGLAAVIALATEESERGNDMRQASPFGSVLTARERAAFLKRWELDHASV